jgi:NAD+ synthase (glutamine-hydrolysing)
LEHWYGLFTGLAVAKRIQAPPVLALSRRAYGYDYREAQLTPYLPRRYQELKASLLQQERLF